MTAEEILRRHRTNPPSNNMNDWIILAMKAYAEAEREKAFNGARFLKSGYPEIDNVYAYDYYKDYKKQNPLT